MLWLDRLQQRLSLTRTESLALVMLSGLFIVGILARHVQQRAVPVPEGAYDEIDRLFFELSADTTGHEPGDGSTRTSRGASREDAREDLPVGGGGPGQTDSWQTQPEDSAGERAARIDLNSAGAAELDKLPRIGPALAQRILVFRSTYGPFHAVDDLRQVRGIGDKTIELIRPHAYVAPVRDHFSSPAETAVPSKD